MSNIHVTILGTGNTAHHLIRFFSERDDAQVAQVYGRNIHEASGLALQSGCGFTGRLEELNTESDLYIIAVSDDAVAAVASQMPRVNGVVVHVSGSLDCDVLNRFSRFGVFYPLQTFSKGKPVDWSKVVVCVEGSDQKTEDLLAKLAKNRVKSVEHVDSAGRSVLHLAAVFACNFSNHMFAVSEELLGENGISFGVMESLVRETVEKAFAQNPKTAQTGPALRGDTGTLNKHRKLLADKNNLLTLYNEMSKSILKIKNQKK